MSALSSRTSRKNDLLGKGQLEAVAEFFAILSEPTRLRILRVLQDGPSSVGDIVNSLKIKQANASKQLGILYQAGVLARKQAGNSVVYSIRMPLIFDLCDLVCDGLRSEALAKVKLLS